MLSRFKIAEGWFTLLLVWILVSIAAAAILNAELISGFEYLPVIATLAVLTGLALAKSKFSGQTAVIFALIYGLFLVTFFLGRELPGDLTWRERIGEMIGRQLVWISKAISQGSSRDGLIFVIHTSFVFWLLGFTAAWFTFRGSHVWRVVLPSGLVLLSVVYYYYGPKPLVTYLALYTLVALVYIARSHLVSQEREWHRRFVRYEEGIRLDFLQASLLAAVIALGIAWILPAAPASAAVGNVLGESGVHDTWRGFQESWTRLFSSLRTYGASTNDIYRGTLALGGPRTVGDSLIMDVYVEEYMPYVYWQAVVYDKYQEGRWSISESERVQYLPDDGKYEVPDYVLRTEVPQTFINYVPNSGTVYGAPEISGTDRQVYVTQSRDDAGNSDIHMVQSRFVMRQGDRYEVTSNYSLADATSLRGATQVYPEWITERYLQLSETVTPETIRLAEELTAGIDNPFDKAIAVRNHLRNNITYNDQINAPPDGVEPVHYILFDRQEAYCNYYASAMILMLRSQGIPSRFVSGYAQGEWIEEAYTYRVRSHDSHSWVEVFFPGYGWIQFEPTASQPAGDRPESTGGPGDAFGEEAFFGPEDPRPFEERGLLEDIDDFDKLAAMLAAEEAEELAAAAAKGRARSIRIIMALILAGGAIVVSIVATRMNRRVEASVERSYGRLANWGRWLGVIVRPAHTPYERATMLSAAVPGGKEPLRNMTHQYVRQRFSPDRAVDEDYTPRKDWKTLRPLMIREAVAFQLRRLRSRWQRE